MEKDSFLDTNIIINYSKYNKEIEDRLPSIIKKCYLFITTKKGKFILCGAVHEEIHKVIKKKVRIHKAIIRKIQNPEEYFFEKDTSLSFRDVPYAKKLYEKFKKEDPEKVGNIFRSERVPSEIAIQKFLNFFPCIKVIPTNSIDLGLANKLHNYIENYADCKILASALQFQQGKKSFLFVTTDGKDFDPNTYKYIQEQFEINFPDKNYEFPELLNLIYTD